MSPRRTPPILCVAAAAALLTFAQPADACLCEMIAGVMPADGSDNVPTNALLFVRSRLGAPGEFSLQGKGGVTIPLTVQGQDEDGMNALFILRPLAGLEPFTTYQLWHPNGADVLSEFTTGGEPDTEAPRFAGIADALLEATHEDSCDIENTCAEFRNGYYHRLTLDFPAVDDIAYYELHYRRENKTFNDGAPSKWRSIMPMAGWDGSIITSSTCAPTLAPALDPSERHCFRMIAYDQAGNPAGGDAEVCSQSAECANLCGERAARTDSCDFVPATPQADAGCSAATVGPARRSSIYWLLVTLAGIALCRRRALSRGRMRR